MQRQKGFTLIEMMLVIAVMVYHRRAETARIDKVSVEIQHILEAAFAYDVDQQKWPDSQDQDNCSATSPDTTKDFVKDYIPNQDYQSSYGSYFCWSKVGDDDDARLFWVALKVPNNNTALANRIATRLPNAVVTPDLSQEDVVQPPTSSSKYKITFNACPTADLPRVTVFPNNIYYPKNSWPGFTVEDIDAEQTNEACTTSMGDDGKLKQSCNIAVHIIFCTGLGSHAKCSYKDAAQAQHPGSADASYIIACIPKDTP